jgi:hypothetical protein
MPAINYYFSGQEKNTPYGDPNAKEASVCIICGDDSGAFIDEILATKDNRDKYDFTPIYRNTSMEVDGEYESLYAYRDDELKQAYTNLCNIIRDFDELVVKYGVSIYIDISELEKGSVYGSDDWVFNFKQSPDNPEKYEFGYYGQLAWLDKLKELMEECIEKDYAFWYSED